MPARPVAFPTTANALPEALAARAAPPVARVGRRLAAAMAVLLLGGVCVAQVLPAFHARPKLRPPAALAALPPASGPRLGDPLPGLTPEQAAAFAGGRTEFMAEETPAGGLGPVFNDRSCVACHSAGGVGGASGRTVTRFGRLVNGQFDDLAGRGGSLLQAQAIDPRALERIPAEANVIARRVTTPLFGAGLIEAIPDEAIVLNAQRPQPDGVRGKVVMVTDVSTGTQRVGRFGWKAQQATLLAFAGDAYLHEMGVTNRFFPVENAPNGNTALLARFDTVPDVEDAVDPATGEGDVDHAAHFMRLLAPPPPLRATASALAGARVFERLQCVACHTPVLSTGPSPIAALAHQSVRLFSDLLVHDMGRLGDGIAQGPAGPREMRTAPLWGLRARPALLHDGRARTASEAILAHDGEGAAARERFRLLSPAERQQLLDYLNTL